jgi:hypothetical protein
MKSRNGRLLSVGAEAARLERFLQQRHSLRDLLSVPERAILVLQSVERSDMLVLWPTTRNNIPRTRLGRSAPRFCRHRRTRTTPSNTQHTASNTLEMTVVVALDLG